MQQMPRSRQEMTIAEKLYWKSLPESQPSRTASPYVPRKYDKQIIYDPSWPAPVVNLDNQFILFILAGTRNEEEGHEEPDTDDKRVEPLEGPEDTQLDLEAEFGETPPQMETIQSEGGQSHGHF